jgi:hypothetical protein
MIPLIAETYCPFIGKGVIMVIEAKKRLTKPQDADVSQSMFVYACEFMAQPDNTGKKKPWFNPYCGSDCPCPNLRVCSRD